MENYKQTFVNKAPLVEALKEYSKHPCVQFHIPGHTRGNAILPAFKEILDQNVSLIDTTDEFDNLGTLHPATGAIKEAQVLCAKAFGAQKSFFLLNGSTIGNLVLAITKIKPKDKVIIARNSHRSVISGMIFADANPIWLLPNKLDNWGIWGCITPEMVEDSIKKNPDAKLVWVTSPTYEGVVSDVEGIAKVCKKYGITLFVDEAHGTLWNFSDRLPKSALQCGADAVVHSFHKTAGSFSQSSVLHISKNSSLKIDEIESNLRLIHTTSPSILLLSSLDAARAYLSSKEGLKLIEDNIDRANYIRQELQKINGVRVLDNEDNILIDPTKIYIQVEGMSGARVETILELEFQVEVESSNNKGLLALSNIGNTKNEADFFIDAIRQIAKASFSELEHIEHLIYMPLIDPEIVYSPRDAFYMDSEKVFTKNAVGRICAEVIAECPPGIFILLPGERITQEHIHYLQNYEHIHVLK